MVKQGAVTNVTRTIFGRFAQFPQHQYVDISMDGKIIAYRTYDSPCSGSKLSTQFVGPIPSDPNILMGQGAPGFKTPVGCGNAVSPDGSMTGSFGGSGHEALIYQNVATLTTVYLVNNLTQIQEWCDCGLPASNYGGTDFGHGWSVNSTKWTVVSVGCDNRFAKAGCDQFLVNAQEQKVIDVTRNCIDGNNRKAHRGDLWVSSQTDVDQAYWTFVQNRAEYQSFWDDIMAGLGGSSHVAASLIDERVNTGVGATDLLNITHQTGCLEVCLDNGGISFTVELFDLRGIRIAKTRSLGEKATLDVPAATGRFSVVRVKSAQKVTTRGIFLSHTP